MMAVDVEVDVDGGGARCVLRHKMWTPETTQTTWTTQRRERSERTERRRRREGREGRERERGERGDLCIDAAARTPAADPHRNATRSFDDGIEDG